MCKDHQRCRARLGSLCASEQRSTWPSLINPWPAGQQPLSDEVAWSVLDKIPGLCHQASSADQNQPPVPYDYDFAIGDVRSTLGHCIWHEIRRPGVKQKTSKTSQCLGYLPHIDGHIHFLLPTSSIQPHLETLMVPLECMPSCEDIQRTIGLT